jgi:DNA-directed RNA polymerase specialized sigma24 family protein
MNCHLSTDCRSIEGNFSTKRIPDRPEKDETKKMNYALPSDFCKVFVDHLDDFYTLSLLLTADHDKASQCFVSGLEDCIQGNSVFREWARSWARRMVIKNAIRLISPLSSQTNTTAWIPEPLSVVDASVSAITNLQPFDRFVFVLSVLERYSDRECSMLLDCTAERVVRARIRALQRMAHLNTPVDAAKAALTQSAA